MKAAPRLLLAILPLCWAGQLRAQGTWDAMLHIDPYPSPYYSDWDVNPSIATLTVFNSTTSSEQVRIHFNITNRANQIVLSGTSELQTVGAGSTAIFENPYEIEGTTQRDAVEDELAARTGRLREGDYRACAVVADRTGFSLTESCSDFTIVYPDPPMLLGPDNSGVIEQADPLFQWTPVQVPVAFQLTYVMRVVEVLSGQTPADALRSNIPHYQSLDGMLPSLRYPVDARPFETGKTYAWAVQVLDQNGYAPATNDGRSEIWTFTYDDGTGRTPKTTAITFSLANSVESDDATTKDADDSTLPALCTGGKPGFLGLNVKSPLGFPAFKDSPATLFQDTTSGEWWVMTENQTLHRQVLMHGNCQGPLGGLQWVASKKIGRQQSLNEWLAVNMPPIGIQSLDYGVFVLAIKAGKVDAPAEFREASEFMAGHEIEVLRGLNAFAVVNLHEHDFWSVFESLGYQEKQIELQGFVGFDASWAVSVTGAVSDGEAQGTVDLSKQRTFLELRVAFPERTPIGPLAHIFESMRLGLELSIEDSTGWSLGAKHEAGSASAVKSKEQSFDIVPKITHTMVFREDRFPNIQGSRELEGSFGLDFAWETETDDPLKNKAKQRWIALQRKSGKAASAVKSAGAWFGYDPDAVVCAADPKKGTKTDFVLTYGLNGDIVLGPVVIEDPAFEIHIQKSADGKAVSGDDRGLSFAFATAVRGVDWDRAIGAGISVAREKDDGVPADSTCSPRKRRNAVTTPLPGPQPNPNAPPQTRPRSDANADQTTPPKQPAKPEAKWTVQWRIASEGMPLLELIRSIIGAIAGVISAIAK